MLRGTARCRSKPTVVVVGTGWAGSYFARDLDTSKYHLEVLSRRNHMVFTPLLPQTTTGTLEFRSVCEPIVRIQPALTTLPHRFCRCFVYGVNVEQREVNCVGVGVLGASQTVSVQSFAIRYDKLVLAHGAQPNTFNIPGVEDNAFFLREVYEARAIRKRLVQNIMAADLPTTTPDEARRLLHTVVVGGGPTGIEFAANLAEFFRQDIRKVNTALLPYCKVTVLEAGEVFGNFDNSVRKWGVARLAALGVQLVKSAVVSINEREVVTKDGKVFPMGLVVWSTGVGPTQFTQDLPLDKTPAGRLAIDDYLRVLQNGQPVPDVYAIGDCAANTQKPLPTLAAVASRHGTYLAQRLNRHATTHSTTPDTPFTYKSLGTMISLGDNAAIVEIQHNPQQNRKFDFVGLRALFFWRSAYLHMLGSARGKLYVAINWFGSRIFGRDITYIGDLEEDRLWKAIATEGATQEQRRQAALQQLKTIPKRKAP